MLAFWETLPASFEPAPLVESVLGGGTLFVVELPPVS